MMAAEISLLSNRTLTGEFEEKILEIGFLGDDIGDTEPGLGKHLYDALDQAIPVVGIAKNNLPTTPDHLAVCRGGSITPFYVTSVGIDPDDAKKHLLSMHGDFRIPVMLKRADQIARG